jgi:hypothetical protein
MFGWLRRRPRCPVGTWEKTWTETRMRWLADRLGLDRLRRAEVILPNDHFFPDPYRGTAEDVRRMMNRLCAYMGIDPGTVELLVSPDVVMPAAAGMYHRRERLRAVIRIAESQLADPPALAATLAHELAHEILLGGGLLDEAAADHEWVTDLLPVYLGVGVFAANDTIREADYHEGRESWWEMSRQGYLPSRIFGYAMALFALMRGEHDPVWAKHLRLDAASACRDGLRYMRQTGDSLFHPDTIATARPTPGPEEVVVRLRGSTASVRLAALWDVSEHALTVPECLGPVHACLADDDPAVAAEAAGVLAEFGPSAAAALPRLRKALWSDHDEVRIAAAGTLGTLDLEPTAAVPELCALLGEGNPRVFQAAAQALGQLGARIDERAMARLLDGLGRALVDCDDAVVEILARTLLAVTDDPQQCVRMHLARDPGLRRQVLLALAESGPPRDRQ